MPLILLSGYPSSGLTHRAEQIKSYFTTNPPSSAPSFKIVHISDDILSIPRSAYDNARSEKDARAALSSAIKRNLGRETLVIADAMNYIKGFRYQMYCEAKAAGTPSCVVHVAANPEQAIALHDRRTKTSNADPETVDESKPDPPPYAPETFKNLISRYEEPLASSRWDSPLFTVPYSDPDPPCEEIVTALFSGSSKKISITKSLLTGKPIQEPKPDTMPSTTNDNGDPAPPKKGVFVKPHLATVAPKQMSSDALYILEKTTSSIVKEILSYISTAGITECSSETLTLPSSSEPSVEQGEEDLTLTLPNTGSLSVAHLQRLKRQFVSLYRLRGVGMGAATSGGKGALGSSELSEPGIRRAFVGFLQTSFHPE